MNEAFISYLWKYRRLLPNLVTEAGDPLIVLHPGEQNTDSGPDFFNARLKIGETTWAGNVEIHLRSSDWYRHGHQHDQAYRNAILHVVLENDHPVCHSDGSYLQTLVVKDSFSPRIFEQYSQMQQNEQWVPCFNQLKNNGSGGLQLWLPALAVERLMTKSGHLRQIWENSRYNWDETFYCHLAWCFGFRVNNTPFELLARTIPLKIARQHCQDTLQTEALFFGMAGMLKDDFGEEYPELLKNEYHYLKAKYRLTPVESVAWKYLRMRPSNFPTIRISQWAEFLRLTEGRFFQLLEHGEVPEILRKHEIFASDYWNTHYLFGKPSVYGRKVVGKSSLDLLIINGIAPFLFFYGNEKDQSSHREQALSFLEQTDPEVNAVTDHWKQVGIKCGNALHSQALLQLKRNYCDRKRCLECRIGCELLSG